MKVVILDDVIEFAKEHNFQTISLKQLRDMAVDADDGGLTIAYKAGYGKCNQVVIEAMAEARP